MIHSFLLIGQSNAAGCSRDEYLQKNVSPEQYAKYENGFDNVYEMLTLDANMDVMAILDAVMKSNESKKEEKISD